MKRLLRKLPLLLFLAGIVTALAYGFRSRPERADLRAVARGPLLVTVNEDGKTRARDRYIITAPLAGKLRRLKLKAGADLEEWYRGQQPLALLEPQTPALLDGRARAEAEARKQVAESRVEEAKERVKQAEEHERFARTDFLRVERSTAAGGGSRQERDDAEAKLRAAERDLAARRFAVQVAQFEVKLAQAVLEPGENGKAIPIVSPISKGKVLKVFQESERVVTAGAEIMEVGDPEYLEAEIDVLTQDAVRIRNGFKVFLEHWGGDVPLEGKVCGRESGFMKQSALGVEEQRVNIIVDDFRLPDKYRGQLGDAYRVEARIVVWESKDVLKVPAGALFRQDKDWAVYLVQNGKATLRTLKIDHNNGLEAEVIEGLKEGDEVVLHPGDKIKEGVEVVPRTAE